MDIVFEDSGSYNTESLVVNLVRQFVEENPVYDHHFREGVTTEEMLQDITTCLLLHPSNRKLVVHFCTVAFDVIGIACNTFTSDVPPSYYILMSTMASELPHTTGMISQAILTSGINISQLSQACTTSPEELSSVLFAVNLLLRCGCILESRSLLNVSLCSLLQAADNVVRRQTSDLLCNLLGVTPSFRAQCQVKFPRTTNAFQLSSSSSSTLLSSSLRRMQTRDSISMDTSDVNGIKVLYRKVDYSLIAASLERKYSMQICGMNVPIFKKLGPDLSSNSANKSSQLRPVDCSTTRENLRKLVTAIMMDCPLILQGPAGSGKSYLLKQVAELVGQRDGVVELNLDEQVDSKALLGNFVCTEVPGEFIWRPGILTSAVIEGNWLVLENFERISMDIIASIVYLLETKRLPGYSVGKEQDIIAHPAFRLIGTQTIIDSSHTELASMRHLISFFHIVRFSPLAVDELELVLEVLFPQIIIPARRTLLQVFYTFSNARSGSRKVSIRDLIKVGHRLCKRIDFNHESKHMPETQRRMACLECVDIFCNSTRDIKQYESEVSAIGLAWGLAPEVIYNDVIDRKTPLSVGTSSISIGRVDFPNAVEYDKKDTSRGDVDFSFTNYSIQLMEKIAAAISQDEVVLLVGETGCGKTTCVQQLADLVQKQLIVQNLSLSTDQSDLLGGFKPVTTQELFRPIYNSFLDLFESTFSRSQNESFLNGISVCFRKHLWKKILDGFLNTSSKALMKTDAAFSLREQWELFHKNCQRLLLNLPKVENGFAFLFKEGLLVDALRNGKWILLDEINLSTSETLQSLSGILEGKSILLSDKGDLDFVPRHPDFRLFAAMNPPTDVGKKELAENIRSRFTEIYVNQMLNPKDLESVVHTLIPDINEVSVKEIVEIYLSCLTYSSSKLVDSAGMKPHYSLRSLTRALKSTRTFLELNIRPFNRAAFEGFLLSFVKLLDLSSEKFMTDFIYSRFISADGKVALENLSKPPPRPKVAKAGERILVKPFWLQKGPLELDDWDLKSESGTTRFVLTISVEMHVRTLAAAIAANVAPVLLQGPTSVGKTTIIEYLAAKTGHKCVRINNHDHTDVQEYIGGYVTNSQGRLEFRDGLLVEALKNGHWIILDELNLAPSDVLEALNRLLDDNHELHIPETGEIVRPAPGFFLFATQNPPGIYGGRKPLSRAFRNRFFEVSINDLQPTEIETIVTHTCGIAPKYSSMLVKVMQELQKRRQNSLLLQGKYGTITMRDLIKWGRRQPQSPYDVVKIGYMLIGEKLRSVEEKRVILDVLTEICKCVVDVEVLYHPPTLMASLDCDFVALTTAQENLRLKEIQVTGVAGIACTNGMVRMWKLLCRAFDNNEPVLFIGDTGCGKTTVCQLYAAHVGQTIRILNCHQSTETADIVGGLRPVQGRKDVESELRNKVENFIEFLLEASTNDSAKVSKLLSLKTSLLSYLSTAKSTKELLDELQKLALNEEGSDECVKKKQKKNQTLQEKTESVDFVLELNLIKNIWVRQVSLFEWVDGPLVTAMKNGDVFVLDEINLADDAIIERLNSVLESNREITLAEKGGCESEKIIAHPNFKFVATMNPSGDFGKRELSPALRSRFTEVWVPTSTLKEDLVPVIVELLSPLKTVVDIFDLASNMVEFLFKLDALGKSLVFESKIFRVSIRELIAWVNFINSWCNSLKSKLPIETNSLQRQKKKKIDPPEYDSELQAGNFNVYFALVHAGHMVFIDGLGAELLGDDNIEALRAMVSMELLNVCPEKVRKDIEGRLLENILEKTIDVTSAGVVFADFKIDVSNTFDEYSSLRLRPNIALNSKNTKLNIGRILRAMQLQRPILLEGPPGVGKSSVVKCLAELSGHQLVRINLSEHSDLSDLLGSNLPVTSSSDDEVHFESGSPKFSWCDGVFLKAMKNGYWVLLDELNLAPQSVLEGLNSCFDHRQRVYIPEIDQIVDRSPMFRIFCTQNPMLSGDGRKGLPQSFLSRLTSVSIKPLTDDDLFEIAKDACCDPIMTCFEPQIPQIIEFVKELQMCIQEKRLYGKVGFPWEFNVRDILRLFEILRHITKMTKNSLVFAKDLERCTLTDNILAECCYLLFIARMRTVEDRISMTKTFQDVFKFNLKCIDTHPDIICLGDDWVKIGISHLPVNFNSFSNDISQKVTLNRITGTLCKVIESISCCVMMKWPVLLSGTSGSGKKRCIRHLAELCGYDLIEFSCSTSTDISELLGSFEQSNESKFLYQALTEIHTCASVILKYLMLGTKYEERSLDFFTVLISAFTSVLEIKDILEKKLAPNSSYITDEEILSTLDRTSVSLWHVEEFFRVSPGNVIEEEVLNLSVGRKAFTTIQKLVRNFIETRSLSSEKFIWVDGIVTSAVEKGRWLLLDNVNLCPASVLDRLNALLEPKGSLFLSECGFDRNIIPHDNFRIFLSVDAACGELSRAMRNRCVEISVNLDEMPNNNFLHEITGRGDEFAFATNDTAFVALSSIYHEFNKGNSFSYFDSPRKFRNLLKHLQVSIGLGMRFNEALLYSVNDVYYSNACLLDFSSMNSLNSIEVVPQQYDGRYPPEIFSIVTLLQNTNKPNTSLYESKWFQALAAQTLSQFRILEAIYIGQPSKQCTLEALSRVCNNFNPEYNISTYLLGELIKCTIFFPDDVQILLNEFGIDETLHSIYSFWRVSIKKSDLYIFIKGKLKTLIPENFNQFVIPYLFLGENTLFLASNKLSVLKNFGLDDVSNYQNISEIVFLWRYCIEIVVFDRFGTLILENQHLSQASGNDFVGSQGNLKSLFAVAHYVDKGIIVAGSKYLKLICCIYGMILSIDEVVHNVAVKILSAEIGISKTVDFFDCVLVELLRRRDYFSCILRRENDISDKNKPWNEIIYTFISLELLCGTTDKLLEELLCGSHNLMDPISSALIDFKNVAEDYWERQIFIKQSTLWALGGHAVIPNDKFQWNFLMKMELTWKSVDTSIFDFPNKPLECSHEEFLHKKCIKRTLVGPFRREWLAFYTTYKFSFVYGVSMNEHQAEQILEKMSKKFNSKDHLASDCEYIDNEFSDKIKDIENELTFGGIVAVFLFSENIIVQNCYAISNMLAYFINSGKYLPNHVLKNELLLLKDRLQIILELADSNSLFDVKLFSEFQTLNWFVDKLLTDWTLNTDFVECCMLFRSALSVIDFRLQHFQACSVHKNLAPSGIIWGSPTLDNLFRSLKFDSSGRDGDVDIYSLSFDIGHLNLSQLVICLMSSITKPNRSTEVSSYFGGTSIISAKRVSVVCSEIVQLILKLPSYSVLSHIRLDLLDMHIFDILESCSSFFSNYNHQEIHNLRNSVILGQLRHKAYGQLLDMLLLDPSNNIEEPSIRSIFNVFQKFFYPLLEDLSVENLCAKKSRLSIGCQWVLLGLTRLHLVIPKIPVDPTTEPKLKTEWLACAIDEKSKLFHASHLISVVKNGNAVSKSNYKRLEDIELLASKQNSLKKVLVERPSHAREFSSLFIDLQEFLDTTEKYLDLAKFIKKLVNEITSELSERDILTSIFLLEEKIQEESVLQSILSGVFDALSKNYLEYEDILSPVFSAIQNISWGFRSMLLSAQSTVDSIRRPHIKILNNVTNDIFSIISFSSIVPRTVELFDLNLSRMLENIGNKKTLVSESSSINLSLLSLVFVETLSALNILNPFKSFSFLRLTIESMIQNHIQLEKEEAHKLIESTKYFVQESNYVSNEEKEENESLSRLFPDHLEKLVSEAYQSKSEDERFESSYIQNFSVTTCETESTTSFRITTTRSLVSIMFRMVFIHNQSVSPQLWHHIDYFKEKKQQSNKLLYEAIIDKQFLCTEKLLQPIGFLFDSALDAENGVDFFSSNIAFISSLGDRYSKHFDDKENKRIALARLNEIKVDNDLLFMLDNDFDSPWRVSSFHLDPAPKDIVKSSTILLGIVQKTLHILDEFPENEILQDICKVARYVANLKLSTSLGKMLSNCSFLLRKILDWEEFAPREFSFADFISKLRGFIIEWRALEIKAWSQLLRCKEQDYCLRAISHFPKISNILFQEFQSKAYSTKEQKSDSCETVSEHSRFVFTDGKYRATPSQDLTYLSEVFETVDLFMRSSTVGEFTGRLHIVRLFALHFLQSRKLQSVQKNDLLFTGDQTGFVIYGLWRYYEQFLPKVTTFKTKNFEPLQQKILDEIKISKWDQLTTTNLLEASEQVHRKLNRIIRQYEMDVLQTPVVSVFSTILQANLVSNSGSLECADTIPSFTDMFPELVVDKLKFPKCTFNTRQASNNEDISLETVVNTFHLSSNYKNLYRIPKLISKAKTYLENRLLITDEEGLGNGGNVRFGLLINSISDEISGDVITRIESLRVSNAVKNMKHRALLDLFDELKAQDVSQLRGDFPAELRQNINIFRIEGPLCEEVCADLSYMSSLASTSFDKAERYFYRSLTELNELRAQANSVTSKDLSSSEVRAIVTFSESLFSLLIRQRNQLAVSVDQLKVFHLSMSSIDSLCNDFAKKCQSSRKSFIQNADTKAFVLQTGSMIFNRLLLVLRISKSATEFTSFKSCSELEMFSKLIDEFEMIILNPFSDCSDCIDDSKMFEKYMLSTTHKSFDTSYDDIYFIKKLAELSTALSCSLSTISQFAPQSLIDGITEQITCFTKYLNDAYATFHPLTKIDDVCKNHDIDRLYEEVEKCVNLCLLSVQNVQDIGDLQMDTVPSLYQAFKLLEDVMRNMKAKEITMSLTNVCELIIPIARNDKGESYSPLLIVNQLRELSRIICSAFQVEIEDCCLAFKSTGKLLYICLRLFRTLLAKGFCAANIEETDGDDNGNMTFEDDVDGTGLGEGQGKTDVSKEIENEDDLLGNKSNDKEEPNKEKQPNKQLNKKEEESGVEMSQDFDGELFDLAPEDPNDSAQQPDMDESDEDIDKELGDVDDNNIIDEKRWSDSDNDDDEIKEGPDGQESRTGDAIEDELRTKDHDDDSISEGDDGKHNAKESKEESEAQDEDGFASDAGENEDNKEESGVSETNKDSRIDETNMEVDDAGEEPVGVEEEQKEDINNDEASSGDGNVDEMEKEEEFDANEDLKEDDRDEMEPDCENLNGPENAKIPESSSNLEAENFQSQSNKETGRKRKFPTFGVKSTDGLDDVVDDGFKQRETLIENESQDSAINKPQTTEDTTLEEETDDFGGLGKSGYHQHRESSIDDSQTTSENPPNPFRSPGDVNEAWFRRLNIVEDNWKSGDEQREETDYDQNTDEKAKSDVFEYSEDNKDFMQVMANSMEGASLPKDNMDSQDRQDMVTEKEVKSSKSASQSEEIDTDRKKHSNDTKEQAFKDGDNEFEEEIVDDNLETAHLNNNAHVDDDPFEATDKYHKIESGGRMYEPISSFTSKVQKAPNDITTITEKFAEIHELCPTNFANDQAQCRWQWHKHKMDTEGFAIRLCEQLRLILEPTKATRLKGDYRTGKRINMRKVIGYVASGFRKDKIWLRRTKPAKRTYQVMLMVDNSSSMGEAGPLAVSAIAMVSSALSRLEAGDISVASFAENVTIVHPFGQPFTDDSGARILSEFNFDATETKLASCLRAISVVFETSRTAISEKRSHGCPMQLCFVISDARIDTDNREDLRNLISELAGKNILVVLLIIDKNKNEKDSILSTKSVEFTESGIITRAYLDDFPFPYFAAIQKLDALPEVLSETLKQWFQMIRSNILN